MEGLILVFSTLLLVLHRTASVNTTSAIDVPSVRNFDERGNAFLNDMRFEETESGELVRNGILGSQSRWEGGVIPYTISPAFSGPERQIIYNGMRLITSTTCITFKARSRESNYVDIRRGAPNSGCNSFVGKTRGGQVLNLESPNYCMQPGVVAHELIHAIGFHHEQQRPDRESIITVITQNIRPQAVGDFKKIPNALTYNVPYDIKSIMHYNNRAASSNGRPTMLLRDGRDVEMGQIKGLTRNDISKIRQMYNC